MASNAMANSMNSPWKQVPCLGPDEIIRIGVALAVALILALIFSFLWWKMKNQPESEEHNSSFLMIISLLCQNYHKEISVLVKLPRTAMFALRSLWRVRALLSFLNVSMHSILHVLRHGWLGTVLLVLFVDST